MSAPQSASAGQAPGASTGAGAGGGSGASGAAQQSNVASNPTTPSASAQPQNLNQIQINKSKAFKRMAEIIDFEALDKQVLEYLNKKGYRKSEATLRAEAAQMSQGQLAPERAEDRGSAAWFTGYYMLKSFVDETIEYYKPELQKLLWPVFVYSLLSLVSNNYADSAQQFYDKYSNTFGEAFRGDVQRLAYPRSPDHLESSAIAKVYLNNKWRVSLTRTAFDSLMLHLEKRDKDGGTVIIEILQHRMQVRTLDRAASGAAYSFKAMMARGGSDHEILDEDEGIPGHNPGSANTDPNAPPVLAKVTLGALPREAEQEEDLKGELEDHDAAHPPEPGQPSLMDEFKKIKEEEDVDAPSRETIPLPKPTARDVEMEVLKIREHRDRFAIPPRSTGIAAGISIAMYTFHNTRDTINCLDFSGDNALVAAGTADSYIRIWTIDGSPLPTLGKNGKQDTANGASRRLIGHSGPVYAVSFSPAMPQAEDRADAPDTTTQYLLSASFDKTIRLWYVGQWSCLIVYKGHVGPVWDVQWHPHGHYFATAGNDKSARLWRTDSASALRIFAGHDSDVERVAWHPNGMYVFTAGYDKTVRMWDVSRGAAVRLFTGHSAPVTALECSPNGKTLASADDNGNIILWDVGTGSRLKRMRGHTKGGIWSLAWSVESSLLVSGGADCTVRSWDPFQTSDGTTGRGSLDGNAKTDSSTIGSGLVGMAGGKKGKSTKEAGVTPDQISAFPTKRTPVYKVRFTQMNLVVAGGAFLPG